MVKSRHLYTAPAPAHDPDPRDCTNIDEQGNDCRRPAEDGAPVSLCRVHLVLAAQFIIDMKRSRDAARPAPTRAYIKYGRPQVVYYLRLGNRIKIGTSTNLLSRLQSIPHDELLAVEPGSNARERARHAQFAQLRTAGEWFRDHPTLRKHIAQVRAAHGAPLDVWDAEVRRHAEG